MQYITTFWSYISDSFVKYNLTVIDVLEMLILAWLIYKILGWIQSTRTFVLLRGIAVIGLFLLVAELLDMTAIMWVAKNVVSVALMAIVVIFQPELRRMLEELGRNNIFQLMNLGDRMNPEGKFSDKTMQSIVKACTVMSGDKTGALILLENYQKLTDYVETGIEIDAVVSMQLLVNIFEHNTPLHDGAVVISGDRVVAAPCYLPLSEDMSVSKQLGTRPRAALGASENTDAFVIVVSEETGQITVAREGVLSRGLSPDQLLEQLSSFRQKEDKPGEEKPRRRDWLRSKWEERKQNEKQQGSTEKTEG
ncbi:MAG: diadenylate cyclase CdaA [Lachnospiraceae bacterium]|nr:diadenylate cyclase CdaA [Lachnospiraceae bacterium]